MSPSRQPKSLQLPPGNYLRNKQVLIHISAAGREFCIAASTVPTVLTTAQLLHPVLHWHQPKEQFRNRTWPHQQGCGHVRVTMAQDTIPDTSLGGGHWRSNCYHSPYKKLLTESIKWLVHWTENGAWKTWNVWVYKKNSAISPSQPHFICLPLPSSTEWWYLYLPMIVKCLNIKHYRGKPQKISIFLWKMA